MEAMSAKCAVVCPNYAALPETAAGFANMYQFEEDMNTHANKFANLLNMILHHYFHENHISKLNFQKTYADNFYSWDSRISEWQAFLKGLL